MRRFILFVLAAVLAWTGPTDAFSAGAAGPNAVLLKMVKPERSREAERRGLTGSGHFLMKVDVKTGLVTSVTVVKSTGHRELDDSAIEALRQWRFQHGSGEAGVHPDLFHIRAVKRR
jgi:TonB family protein